MKPASNTKIILENEKASLSMALFGGAITDFHLKELQINPLSFRFSKAEMPDNNKGGAVYQGHFLCLGRWGQPSEGEIRAGMPNHGQAANISWDCEQCGNLRKAEVSARSPLEGLEIKRLIQLDEENAVFGVEEVVKNFNPLGRLYNMVQHPTLAGPFLDSTTIIDCNGDMGFNQEHYRQPEKFGLKWPLGYDHDNTRIDLRNSGKPYNAVFSYIVDPAKELGWITAVSPKFNLVFGYIWRRKDYPWIHLWQHYQKGHIRYKGIEFGTAGIHQPFIKILEGPATIFGEKPYAYIDAGEVITKNYWSFLLKVNGDFEGVENIWVDKGKINIQEKNTSTIHLINTSLNNLYDF